MTCNSVTVSWSAVSGATSYDVSVNGDVRNTTSTSYTYTGLSAGTTYSYAVRAKNDSGSSSYSSAQAVTTLLSIPTSVTASSTSNSVTVSWSAVSGATSYDVSVNGDVRNTTSTSYTYIGLTSGTTYSYAVRAKNSGGSSGYSSSQSIVTNATSIPSLPTGIAATATSSTLIIYWNVVSGAASYDVSVNGDVRNTTSASYTYTGLSAGTTYSYAVRAKNNDGSSSYSSTQSITTIPSTPTGVIASATDNTVTISWSAVSGATSYDVSVNGDVRNTASTSYTYTGLSSGTTYSYAIRAKNSSGFSAYSSAQSIVTPSTFSGISIPSNVTASATSNSVTVTWSGVSGATSYDVSVNGDIRNTTSTSYTYTGLSAGTAYSYAVRAKNNNDSSSYSTSQSITTIPSVPTGVIATASSNSVTVSWSAVSGASSYDVSVNGDVRSTNGTSYTYTGLTSGTTYSYAVKAKNSSGFSAYSPAQSLVTPDQTLSVPTDVTATATADTITIFWNGVVGATNYDISVNGDVRNTTNAYYTYTGLTSGISYTFMVRAKNSNGSSAYSASRSITTAVLTPTVPTVVTATATSNSVTVSWVAVSGVTSYDVSVNGDVRNTTSTSYTYTGLDSDKVYSYAVRANNDNGSSGYSSPQSIVTTTLIPSVPAGISATATSDSITVSWVAVSEATNYDVSVNGDVKNTTSTFYTYTGLASGATYNYAVRANNQNGSSTYSSSKSIITTTVLSPSIEMKLAKGLQMLSPSLDPTKNWLAASGGNYTYVDCIKNRPLLVKGPSDISAGLLRHIFEGLGAQMNITPNTLYNVYDIRMVAAQRAFAEMVDIADAGGMDALTWSKLSETLQQYGEDQTSFDRSEFWRKFDKHFWLLFLAEFNLTNANSDIKHISDFLRAKTPINNNSPGIDIIYLRMVLRGMGLPIADFGAYPNLETQVAIKLLHSQAGLYMDYEITNADWSGPDGIGPDVDNKIRRGIWNYLERFANMPAQQKVDERKYFLSSSSWGKIGKEAAAALDIKIEKNIEVDGKGTITVRCNGADSIVFDVINEEGTTVFMSRMGTTGSLTSDNLSFGSGKYSINAKAVIEVNNKEYKKTSSVGFVVQPINNYQGTTIGSSPVPDISIGPPTGPTQAMIEVRSHLDTLLSTYHAYEYPDGYKIEDFTWGTAYRERYENEIKFSLNVLALQKGIYNLDVLLFETGCVLADIADNGLRAYEQAVASAGPPTGYPPQMVCLGVVAGGIFIMDFFYNPDPRIFRNLPQALGITEKTPPDSLGINGYLNKKIARALAKASFVKNSNYNYLVYMGKFLWLFSGPRQMFIDDLDKYKNETNRRTDVSTAYKKELLDYIEVIKSMNVNYGQSLSDMNYFLNEIDKGYN